MLVCAAVTPSPAQRVKSGSPLAQRVQGDSPHAGGSASDLPAQQLIVFVAPESSELSRRFQSEDLPLIRELAARLHVPLRVVDIANGAPLEITITPLIVFQDYKGRSIYQGRYRSIQRIRNFIRTSRVVPQGQTGLERTNIPMWNIGRTRIVAPIKIAPLTGNMPPKHDPESFEREALRSIFKSFKRFPKTDSILLSRTDRQFYMDFNPWRAPDGTLFLSVSLFSQFHCKKPIFTQQGAAIAGPWSDRSKLFRTAAQTLEREVVEVMATSPAGDGFDPVPRSCPVISWEELGLKLPDAPKDHRAKRDGPKLTNEWIVEPPGEDDPPQFLFHFPAPLDSYAGEVRAISGTFQTGPQITWGGATGSFVADVMSVTMGDPDLDHTVRTSSLFLDGRRHPTSTFVLENIRPDDPKNQTLRYGELVSGTMYGTFTLKGHSVPLKIRTMLEPIVNENDRPRLVLRGGFELHLVPFKIDGPDGPPPASETLLLEFQLTLAPAGR